MKINELFDQCDYQGFHDSYLWSISTDYISRVVKIKLDLVVGRDDRATIYKTAVVGVHDFDYVVCDPPEPGRAYLSSKKAPIDIFEGIPKNPVSILPPPREGSTSINIFIEEWNCFITIVGQSYSFEWVSGEFKDSGDR